MPFRRTEPPAEARPDELESRLQHLTWPGAAEDIKQRCLQAILERVSLDPSASGPASGRHGGVVRYELTRRDRGVTRSPLASPRLQPRFACRL